MFSLFKKRKISESIFSNGSVIIPMADVSHIQKHNVYNGISLQIEIVMDKSKYNIETDTYENTIWLIDRDEGAKEASSFIDAWCYYRHELDGI